MILYCKFPPKSDGEKVENLLIFGEAIDTNLSAYFFGTRCLFDCDSLVIVMTNTGLYTVSQKTVLFCF